MTTRRLASAAIALAFLSAASPSRSESVSTTSFRVFLRDGSTLVSYGEVARVGDRVVFSMPTSTSPEAPDLQLVNLPADRVDWSRTEKYSESARAADYLGNRAAADYALVSNSVAEALNEVAHTADPAKRLAIVEKARKVLADWPALHYNYKLSDVRQMLAILDEAIADLGARAGPNRFNLTLVASSAPPVVLEPILPPPTPQEAIAETLAAAHLSDLAADRMALLTIGLNSLMRDADKLPRDWLATTLGATRAELAAETDADRAYRSLSDRMLKLANERARASDVRGVERLLLSIRAEDETLGGKRRDVVSALVESVTLRLDAARRLQLEREHWQQRLPEFRTYNVAITRPTERLKAIGPLLESIKSFAGSPPEALDKILKETKIAAQELALVAPPDEFRSAHALLLSVAQLADSAARTRREAALIGSMPRAWDASAAAAGALMLADRAQTDIQALLRLPQLQPIPE